MVALSRLASMVLLAGGATLVVAATGCDTGFGQPCDLPKTEEIRAACNPAEVDNEDDDIQRESKASCALKNYAGCETRVCLVYRGSSPFCSETCKADSDCEGSAVCRPLLGDADCSADDQSGFAPECYCVRKGDLND